MLASYRPDGTKDALIDRSKPWFYAGPYVPSGAIYGERDWPSYSHMLVPGFDPTEPFGKIDLYS